MKGGERCGVWGDPLPSPDGTLPGPWEAGPAAGEGYEKYSDPGGGDSGRGDPSGGTMEAATGRWYQGPAPDSGAPWDGGVKGYIGGTPPSLSMKGGVGGRSSGWAGMPGPGLGRCQVPTGTSRVAFAPTRSGDGGKGRALVRDPGGALALGGGGGVCLGAGHPRLGAACVGTKLGGGGWF